MVLRLSRKCDHPAFSLCLQFIRRTCAGESPFSAVAVACSPCARAPRSRGVAPAAARAAYLPFGVPPFPSLPQDEPPTARGRSVAPAGAAGLTAPNPSRNRARGEEPPAATLSRHGRRSRRTAPCPPRPPFRIRASQRFRPYCISVPCVPWPSVRCSRRP